MRLLLLPLLLLAGCQAFDRAIDYAEVAGRVAVEIRPDLATKEQLQQVETGLAAVRGLSASVQGKVDEQALQVAKVQEGLETAVAATRKEDEDSDLAFWLGVAGVAAAASRGVPSKGPIRALVDMLTPRKRPEEASGRPS